MYSRLASLGDFRGHRSGHPYFYVARISPKNTRLVPYDDPLSKGFLVPTGQIAEIISARGFEPPLKTDPFTPNLYKTVYIGQLIWEMSHHTCNDQNLRILAPEDRIAARQLGFSCRLCGRHWVIDLRDVILSKHHLKDLLGTHAGRLILAAYHSSTDSLPIRAMHSHIVEYIENPNSPPLNLTYYQFIIDDLTSLYYGDSVQTDF